MIKTFITSFKLKNTYRVNCIIYSIKQLPFIKRFLPNKLYQSHLLKIIGNIISILLEIIGIFLGKIIYLSFMILLAVPIVSKNNDSDTFIHIFVFLTLIGGILNTFMFNPTKDKYYAMFIMNMDAKKYTLSNYCYMLLKTLIGFLPLICLFGLQLKVPIYICLMLSVFVVIIKIIVSGYVLYDFEKSHIARNENLPTRILWASIAILLLLAYGFPFLGYSLSEESFIIVFVVSFILCLLSLIKINRFKEYKKMYKQILTHENIYMIQNQSGTKAIKDNLSKQIEFDSKLTSNKQGFAYFHDIFVKRHRKILTKAIKEQSIIILVIVSIVSIAVCKNNQIASQVNRMILVYLPYFVFIMYLLNRGTTVTQAMFMNCDYSMLNFRIYRTPSVILGLFKERLKTLIVVNLLPATIIAIALPVILFLSGGTNNSLNYIVLFISIISISIFFSVHYLVVYYLLQPYNINTEIKSSTYQVIQAITYFVCYYMIQIKLPIISFGIVTIIFSILYCFISLFLAYKYAYRTFKIRL